MKMSCGLLAILLAIILPSLLATEYCYESVCEFDFFVRETHSMTYASSDGPISYDVKLEQDGRLELSPNPFHRQVPNVSLTAEMLHTADGHRRRIIVINDEFPGPTLEVMEGAELAIRIYNGLVNEGLTIHWHGFHMRNNVWMDGVPYVTQCPVHSRESFTYRFFADPAGTHWYHSHNRLQKSDGLFGAIIVHRSKPPRLPHFSLILSDWFPSTSTEIDLLDPYRSFNAGSAGSHFNSIEKRGNSFDGVELSPMNYCSGLINGRGRRGGNIAPLTKFSVKRGQRYRLHIVQAAGEFAYRFSIDQHELTVIESDGHPLKPVLVESVLIFPGETYVVEISELKEPGTSYWIRALSLRFGEGFENTQPDDVVWDAKAILQYPGDETNSSSSTSSSSGEPTSTRRNCTSQNPCKVLNCPWPKYRSDRYPNLHCIAFSDLRLDSHNFKLSSPKKEGEQEVFEYFLNMAFPDGIGSSINRRKMAFPRGPLFQDPSTWEITPCPGSADCDKKKKGGCICTNVVSLPANREVQLVLTSHIFGGLEKGTVSGAEGKANHAMHLHGHSFRVLKMGYPVVDNRTGELLAANEDIGCEWSEEKICLQAHWVSGNARDLNFEDPPVKDTLMIPVMGYAVVRFRTENPGYWLFNCHVMLHNLEGMKLIFNVSHSDLPTPRVPKGFPTCQTFDIGHQEFLELLERNHSVSSSESSGVHSTVTSMTVIVTVVICTLIVVLLQSLLGFVLFRFYFKKIKVLSRQNCNSRKDEKEAMIENA